MLLEEKNPILTVRLPDGTTQSIIALQGTSAYEMAKSQGYEGTETDLSQALSLVSGGFNWVWNTSNSNLSSIIYFGQNEYNIGDFPLASSTQTGLITASNQTLGGLKTFNNGITFLKNMYYDSSTNTGSAINLNNGDISGVNGIYFKDAADTIPESLMFYRSATTWDSLRAHNGQLSFVPNYPINSKVQLLNGCKELIGWTAMYMNGSQNIDLSAEPISAQAHGIIIVWSYYSNSTDMNNGKCNWGWNFSFVPKELVKKFSASQHDFDLGLYDTNTSTYYKGHKVLTITDTKLSGNAINSSTISASGITNSKFVLRMVYGI